MDTKNTTASRVPFHDSMPSFMNFIRVLDLLEFINQASQRFADNQLGPGVWNSFPFLAWDLSMHPRTRIWFFDQFICTGACACSSNLNYAHKCIENSVNASKCATNPEKSQIITQHSCCSMLTREKNLKAIWGNGFRFVPKGRMFPTVNHHACCEKLRFVRSIYTNLPQMGQNLYHGVGVLE